MFYVLVLRFFFFLWLFHVWKIHCCSAGTSIGQLIYLSRDAVKLGNRLKHNRCTVEKRVSEGEKEKEKKERNLEEVKY